MESSPEAALQPAPGTEAALEAMSRHLAEFLSRLYGDGIAGSNSTTIPWSSVSFAARLAFLQSQLEKEKELNAELRKRAQVLRTRDAGNFCHCCTGAKRKLSLSCGHQLCANCLRNMTLSQEDDDSPYACPVCFAKI
jgi:hypothetical protein